MSLDEKFTPCDFAKWAKTDLWEVWEAAHILAGIEPPRANDSSCAMSAQPILDTMTRSFMAQALKPAPVRGPIVVFLPLEVIAWAKTKGFIIPRGLEEKVQKNAMVYLENHRVTKVSLDNSRQPNAEECSATVSAEIEPSPRENRAALDISKTRGCRRRILENWDTVEARYGQMADGRQVLRVLNEDKDEKSPRLKTVQNHLAELRKEKLIP